MTEWREGVEWRVAAAPLEYGAAVAAMEARAAAVRAGTAPELIWLVEHPALYTAGTSADPVDLIDPRFPVHATGRGGRYTYHGPGQRVGYLVLDLARRGRDVRCFVHALEGWVIDALARIGIASYRIPGKVGIWTRDGGAEAKIGAIGVRVKRWVTLHGFSVNLSPDLSHFGGIVPCGIADLGVTSAAAIGVDSTLQRFDDALASGFPGFLAALGGDATNRLENAPRTR
ncbi:lipoyl(octanoyl) transferase LipB [Sphingomonas sp.]|uniref:lipoyl(octanoyl) transferase LipB n=1 Tax=Sphingomonas sp. TaxID=28214 RepID=UPI002CC7C740|nr:lipoyl(octanoyl) transferase LipB [Sphingomonas sp.]HWK37175.1 lipoyl(octanoyl) transferase LipB [Sphingomonas sp.]